MTIKSALDLAREIESCALDCSREFSDEASTLCSSFSTEQGTISIELTKYGDCKFFGLARYGNLVGRVKVVSGVPKILSIECDRLKT